MRLLRDVRARRDQQQKENERARCVAVHHFALPILQADGTLRKRGVAQAKSAGVEGASMCRNIKMLFNFDPPVTAEEVRAAALQYVRKVSGFNKPSKANEAAFASAVDEIADASMRLLGQLETTAPPRNREEEAAKARERGLARFGD